MTPGDAFTDFTRTFRDNVYQHLEYSVDEAPEEVGTMVAGGDTILPQIRAFAESLPFARVWAASVQRLVEFAKPITYLFRVNWRRETATSLSIYCRLLDYLPRAVLSEAFKLAHPLQWEGPSPQALGEILGIGGPTGIGLRVDMAGRYHSAMYYRVGMHLQEFRLHALRSLVECCGYSMTVAESIGADLPTIYSPGPVGVVGIDGGRDGIAAALKLDPANVPLNVALAFIDRKGAARERIAQLAELAQHFRMRQVSYVGIKYGPHGFAGWKLYWSIQPRLQAPALATDLNINQPTILVPPAPRSSFGPMIYN